MQNLDLSYDAMGNIQTKSDVSGSTWSYHATKKHAVTVAGSNSYGYDANGNQTTRNGQTLTWTSYNYPSHVPNGTQYHDYFYDANRQRWKQVYYNGSTSETTLFVGGMLEKHTAGGITEYRHTISAGGQPVALYTRPSSGAITTQYFLLDHLGSVAEITNSLSALDVAENFAAFGQRRDASDWSGPPSAADKTAIAGITQRGYTFHTHSEESSLIHMNGRMADSLTGRFLSADPYVFQPLLTQSFNRYSYVNNNPLSYTDPSGFCVEAVSAFLCRAAIGSALSYIGSKLFGKKKKPPPPKGCFVTGGGTACYGKAVATKLFNMASDIYGLPPLRSPGIWGVGNGTFGSGECTIVPNCMSLTAEEVWDTVLAPWGGLEGFKISVKCIWQCGWPGDGSVESNLAAFPILPVLALESVTARLAARAGAAAVGQGFRSHSALTRALGPAGAGKHWHHIVEQTSGNVARFGPQAVHNTQNVMRLDAGVHGQISGFYSSIQPFTNGQTVRQWISSQSFEQQAQFGLDTLRRFGVGP